MPQPLHTLDARVARRIRVVGFDVDGVLTDGGVYMGGFESATVELKRFDIQDNVGFRLLRDAGVKIVLVSGRQSDATSVRARELAVDDVVQEPSAIKLPIVRRLLARFGASFEETAFVGDDLPDIPVLEHVGLPIAVANAVPEVMDAARYVTGNPGGRGAVREVAESLLKARGDWDQAVARYLGARRDATPIGVGDADS